MAENELDGFDNLDDLFSEDKGGGGGEAAAAAGGDLDALLGDAPAGGGDAAGEAPAAGGGSDSELDSFFEDLSTIDDLEVAQEEAPAAAPAAAAAAAPARAEEPAPRRAPAPVKAKKKGGGGVKKFLFLVIVLGAAGAAAYWYLFPTEEVPWEVTMTEEEPVQEEPVREEQPPPPPPKPQVARPAPPPPPPAQAMAPAPAPAPRPAPPTGNYTIQVATCFFPSCVQQFQGWLKAQKLEARVREKSQSRETLEIFTSTTFASRDAAQQAAERINRDNRMEGRAYVFQEGGATRISMGNFTDLGRANIVRDSLNQRMAGEVTFATRVKSVPYTLHHVWGGRFPTRAAAEAARAKLAAADPRFKDAFVTKQ